MTNVSGLDDIVTESFRTGNCHNLGYVQLLPPTYGAIRSKYPIYGGANKNKVLQLCAAHDKLYTNDNFTGGHL
jgi:hypothetical protein